MNKAQRLTKVIQSSSRRILGLMSGMSMDGIDLACADISGSFPNIEVKLIGTHFRPYAKEFQKRLKEAQTGTTAEVSQLNFLVAQEFAKCVEEFLAASQIPRETIDAIGSHGQTLYHQTGAFDETKSSLQVGAPSIIAELTGLLTVGNFRVRDISSGGKGAPLVSLADFILFRRPGETIVMNNLGSISNVTVVTPSIENMIAFDTGPANMVLDFFAQRIPGPAEPIDFEGRHSAQGNVIAALLQRLLKNPFFDLEPPKAAGYEEFGPVKIAALAKPFLEAEVKDLLRTAAEFSAITLSQAYRRFILPQYPEVQRAIFSGGGIYNATLMKRIKELLPELTIEILEKELSDAKEALAFALLANETLSGRPGSLPSVTGTQTAGVLGEIGL
jgi:anhydro-N-acetylmuramic acid kinase